MMMMMAIRIGDRNFQIEVENVWQWLAWMQNIIVLANDVVDGAATDLDRVCRLKMRVRHFIFLLRL